MRVVGKTLRSSLQPEFESDEPRRAWRTIIGILLGAALALVIASTLTSMRSSQLAGFAYLACAASGAVLGVAVARPERPTLRRIVGAFTLALAGGLFGWEMERTPGATVGALLGVPVGALLAWLIEWALGRVPGARLAPAFWSLQAGLCAAAALAGLIKLALGNLDDDDIAFFVGAIFLGVFAARATGWTNEPRTDLPAFWRQWTRVGRWLVRSRLAPFALAFLLAGLLAGPAHSAYRIAETSGMLTVYRELGFLAWPGALALAGAWTAWRSRRSRWRRGILIAITILWVGCGYTAWSVARYAITADHQQLVVHGRVFARAEVQRIEYVRHTGRRFVAYQPVLVLADGRRARLALDSGARAAADFLKNTWGVPATDPR